MDVGDKAPPFELEDDEGRRVSLRALRGSWVVLTFYAEDDTPVCSTQMCSFRDEARGFTGEGAVVFGVSPDPPASHAAWRRREGFPFRLLSDPANKVATRYGAHGEKTMYGKPVVGVIRTTVVIDPEGRIAVLLRRIRTPGHGARVLEALRQARAAAAGR